MQYPMIIINSKEKQVHSIWWSEDGSVSHVYYDNGGLGETIFNDEHDLENIIFWKESKHGSSTN